MRDIPITDWLTKGISKRKLAKEKKKALKKVKKEQCKKYEDCYGCPYYKQTVVVSDTTMTCCNDCFFDEEMNYAD